MVKSEIFGSRPSILRPYLQQFSNFKLFPDFWFITCIKEINPDVDSRYLLVKECKNKDEFLTTDIVQLRPFFRRNIKIWIITFHKDKVYLEWEMNPFEVLSQKGLKTRIIDATRGKYIAESGHTKPDRTPFSRFFRSHLGGSYSLIDIDFMLQCENDDKLILIEEKTFLSKGSGLIGQGQYESFKELYRDVLSEEHLRSGGIIWFLVFVEDDTVHCYDIVQNGFPQGEVISHPQWGKMVQIPLELMKKISLKKFLGMIDG